MGKIDRKPKKAGDSATGELPHAAVQSAARKIGRRLILKFVGEDKPELDRIEFRFKESTAPVFWQRGDDNHGFVWTEVPQAFSILFLDYLWSASQKSSEPFFFRGAKNGSHAASLGDAIHQPKHRIHELFIETFPSGGTTNCVRRVFNGDNLHGKANRDRRVSVKSDFLPPDCVEVFWGERGPLVESGDVQLLANRIRESLGLAALRVDQLPELGVDTNKLVSLTPTTPGPQTPIGDAPAPSQPQAPREEKILPNLPDAPVRFFGHEQLRKEVTAKLADKGLIVLHETGGVGKTTLANQTAHDAIRSQRLPGGAVWILVVNFSG